MTPLHKVDTNYNGFFDSGVVGSRSEQVVAVDSLADIVGPHVYLTKVGTTLIESWKTHCSENITDWENVDSLAVLWRAPTLTRREFNSVNKEIYAHRCKQNSYGR